MSKKQSIKEKRNRDRMTKIFFFSLYILEIVKSRYVFYISETAAYVRCFVFLLPNLL